MKVLEVVHGFPPEARGGTELYARAHALALHACGDDVVVLTREQDPGRPEYAVRSETQGGLRIVSINNTFRETRTFEETYRNETIGAIADRVIDDFKPDVAHIHHLTCLSTSIVGSLADRGIPRILTLHDYWLMCHRGQLLDTAYRACQGPGSGNEGCHACLGVAGGAGGLGFAAAQAMRTVERHLPEQSARQLRRAAEQVATLVSSTEAAAAEEQKRIVHMRELCAQVTHFLAPSRFIRDRFVQFGIPADRITVSPYGIDAGAFRLTSDPTRTDHILRLGVIGTLMVSKGAHVLLEAVQRLPAGSVSVQLFGGHAGYHGDDTYRQTLEPLVASPHVHAHGAIAHEQVPAALESIDALVVPSIWPENSPFVIHEAFLSRTPVIASRVGGIPEMVRDGENGLLCAAGDVADLARTLLRLVRQPELLDSLRARITPPRSIEDDVREARDLYGQTRRNAAHAIAPKRLAAVILNFRTPDQTLLAVKSLLASRRPCDDLIVVDNDAAESADGTRRALEDVGSKVRYLRTGANLGFSGGMNTGIREALARGADTILLANSDVIVPPDTVGRLEQCLNSDASVGIAGPTVLDRSDPSQIASLGMVYAPQTGRMRHRGYGERFAPTRGARTPSAHVDGVSGCLMVIKREVFDAVGLFDEDFFFSFEDLEFCLRARGAGFETALVAQATVYHEGGRSLGATSSRRFYFAARNHLLLGSRSPASTGIFASCARNSSIVALNLAHAVIAPGGSLAGRLGAVALGTRDYFLGRFGDSGL